DLALSNLLFEVRAFMDQCRGVVPELDWEQELVSTATAYDGEEIYPAEPLEFARLEAAPPPREARCAVAAAGVTEGWLRKALLDPRIVLKDPSEIGELPPTPKAWASDEEWEVIAGELLQRGILKPIEYTDIAEVNGRKVFGGLFGVRKSGHQRGSGEVLLWSSEDLKCCFYAHGLGGAWLPHMAISKPVRRATAGPAGSGVVYVSSAVVPMGSAPQPRHVGSEPARGWVDEEAVDGRPVIYVGRGCRRRGLAPSRWGNPYRVGPQRSRHQAVAEFAHYLDEEPSLLAELDSLSGTRLACHCRPSQVCHGDAIIRKWRERFLEPAVWRAWQVYIDNLDVLEVTEWWHAAQLKQEGLCDAAPLARARYEAQGMPRSETKSVARELQTVSLGEAIDGELGTIGPPKEFVLRLVSLTLETISREKVAQKWMQIFAGRWVRCFLFRREAMMSFAHLRRFLVRIRGHAPRYQRTPVSGLVTVSDASVQRGAVCRGVRLRPEGAAAARAARKRQLTSFSDEAVLVSLFDVVGGARRALDLLGFIPALFVASETDVEASHAKWVFLVAGSPCTDLARINAQRVGPSGERPRLFYEIRRVRDLLLEVIGEWCFVFELVENVASMDVEPRELMTEHLGFPPIRIDAADVSHCRRDRFYWIDPAMVCAWQGKVQQCDGYEQVAIPGQFPSGVHRCTEAELQRLRDHAYCYAPYQFPDVNCIQVEDSSFRPPNSVERELLLDFLPGHTATARATSSRKLEPRALEQKRCALLGNSSQCATVAWVVAHWAAKQGYLPRVPDVAEMRETGGGATIADRDVELSSSDAGVGNLVRQHELEDPSAAADPSVAIVEEMIRRAEPRGVGRWSRKPAVVWHWQRPSHTTDLEVRATPQALHWKFRVSRHLRTRFCHLMDSQAGLGVITRGRPLPTILHVVVRRIGALVLAALARPVHGYAETDRNPADHPTRAVVGPFRHAPVQPRTLMVYLRTAQQFSEWLRGRNLSWSAASNDTEFLDGLVAEWIEWLWLEGHPQGTAGSALSAVRFFLQRKRILPASWRLFKARQRLELPQRAPPLPRAVVVSMAALARHWQRNDVAVLLIIAFAAFLRTSEALTLRRWQ
ncbi:unnamed protein product, partial [Prorocentrum cordatum]